jgi:putative peptidoglycan lipid II flippase
MNVPIMLIGKSISTAAFTRLIARLSQVRPDLFRKDFIKILLAMLWITSPVVVVGYFARGYLGRLLYGDVAPAVALIFGYLTAAIVARIIYAMFSRYFYANKDTLTPLYVSIFTIALNIYLAFALATKDGYGIAGLALAQSIAAVVEVGILMVIMVARDRKLLSPYFWGSVIKIISVTGFTVVATYIAISFLPLNASDRGIITLGAKLVAISIVTFIVHLTISLLLGMEEAQAVIRRIKQIILKPVRINY